MSHKYSIQKASIDNEGQLSFIANNYDPDPSCIKVVVSDDKVVIRFVDGVPEQFGNTIRVLFDFQGVATENFSRVACPGRVWVYETHVFNFIQKAWWEGVAENLYHTVGGNIEIKT